ncbi:peptidoglycan-binding protein [Streptomyces sp. PKU-EA00015]|uniref:L,D-transpeptidase family protein n=1 Tax=Streptomyces sp. PKU-EA00015 TaxID=2748326 RepID=UPI0015A32507|nr:L,D-transpeptidase family protein [Streptomyces sp. PKU-EA00015]NWF30709.1 peptidoglycan-binding protein [Streptomyces sp. PKU-EA00015]
MLRKDVAVRTLAAAAAMAVAVVTAGCTAQAATTKPRATATPSASPTTAAPSASRAPEPSKTPSASPSTSAPAPKILMTAGAEGEQVRELQARLAQIGWFDDKPTGTYGPVTTTAVKGFQGKRGLPATGSTDEVTWQKLLGMTTKPTRDELDGKEVEKPKAKLDPRCMTGRVMCISKTTRTLSWMIDGKVLSTMDVRFGSQYTPTREGTFNVGWKSRHHVSTIYHTPMPYAMFFSGGQAVHYSSDFAARGYNGASHGCVNVRDKGRIAALFDQVRTGDKVVIYW